MYWTLLAVMAAIAASSRDAWMKRYFSGLSAYEMALCPLLFSFPLFLAGLFFVEIPDLDSIFWLSLVVAVPIELLAAVCYMQAIKTAPLSLTVPFLAFTPVFVLATGNLILHESPAPTGLFGILIIVAGSYILNINQGAGNFWNPFRAIIRTRGSLLMVAVALLYGVNSVLGKQLLLHSSTMFFAMSFPLTITIVFSSALLMSRRVSIRNLVKMPLAGFISGLLYFAEVITHCLALPLVIVAYFISIKRLSILIGVVYGWLIFKEKHIAFRFSGAILMALGAIIVSIWGR
jgi:uncharacterized membrane protein